MNSDLISTKVAARLPDKIQSFINSLDRGELRVLRATLCKHYHLDFLELPLELRENIYEYIFEKQRTWAKVHLARKTGWPQNQVICPTGILSTCRHIYHEASNVLYRLYPGLLYVNPNARAFGYQLQGIDAAPLVGFRHLDISIRANPRWLHIEYGQGKKGTLGIMLSNWADMLVAGLQHADPSISRTINLEFSVSCWPRPSARLSKYDEVNESWAKVCWFRTQTAEALRQMRQTLQSRIPDIALTITSNVETSYSFLRVDRRSAYELSIDILDPYNSRKVSMMMGNCKSQILTIDLSAA
ncbi:hypothetical protein FKW77_007457 [Venturia effusa]|uniref:F-box domain-containing protein n=1 Tax=Venturia effusa TaxID=50376 RepID=A0A517LHK1_9PEZI|nr:hypothetical protein FKW77_007457 [Venturia effusa]